MTIVPERILVIQTAFIGDVILATSLLEKIHTHLPNAKIDFLVRKGNESLLANHPFINELIIWNKLDSKYKSLYKLLKLIRATKYDAVINTQRFGATGMLTALSGAPIRSGFSKNPFSIGFTHFFSSKTWKYVFKKAGFQSITETKFTPYMSVFNTIKK